MLIPVILIILKTIGITIIVEITITIRITMGEKGFTITIGFPISISTLKITLL
jgi:hypothetical protein